MYLNILFILCCINFLITLSEDTSISRPICTLILSSILKWRMVFFARTLILISSRLLRQLLATLLNIGGIEKNPGPPAIEFCPSCFSICPSPDSLECSICFRLYYLHCISNLSTCSNSIKDLLNIRGKFIFICEKCCTQSDEINMTHNMSNFATILPESVNPVKDEKNDIKPLLNLTLRPPPINILRKWWKILHYPTRPTGSKLCKTRVKDTLPINNQKGVQTAHLQNSAHPLDYNISAQPFFSVK